MAWWFGWGGWGWRRGWVGPWPGRGPFSYLPPWLRPGWLFGRGACWWLFGFPWTYYMYYTPYYLYTPWMMYWWYLPYLYYPPIPYPRWW
ncbi:MAG: hypothetical protein DRJ40_08875 [Thermoprotei archaeon]|nr:MAG: hypothetical protein DRJ40_08875 [Thermoprotei archaeon]